MNGIPEPLNEDHHLDPFFCQEASLDDWLHNRARSSQAADSARTYVMALATNIVIGYYTLSSFSIARGRTTNRLGDGQPDPVPGILIGRLAVDSRFAGRGIGTALLLDALHRIASIADTAGIRAVFADALHEQAARFWESNGFIALRDDPLTLYMRMDGVRATIASL
ncbi:GNAT family N-acetyltransferase [Humibacter antri]